MKHTLIGGIFILLGATNAFAATYSQDCDKMREVLASVASNLQMVDTHAMSWASQLENKGGRPDVESYNKHIQGIADTIDKLTAEVNKSCK